MDSASLVLFRNSLLYKDVKQGLENLILTKITDSLRPPNDDEDPDIRFYIYGGLPERPRDACWCTDNPSWACESSELCPQQPCPVLGQNMSLGVCERSHSNGHPCDDRDCFNPRFEVTTYFQSILKPISNFPRPAWRDRVVAQVGSFDVPFTTYDKFVDAVCLLIEDLHDPFEAENEGWNPHVHGIIGWHDRSVESNIDELMNEAIKAQTDRREEEYLQETRSTYNE